MGVFTLQSYLLISRLITLWTMSYCYQTHYHIEWVGLGRTTTVLLQFGRVWTDRWWDGVQKALQAHLASCTCPSLFGSVQEWGHWLSFEHQTYTAFTWQKPFWSEPFPIVSYYAGKQSNQSVKPRTKTHSHPTQQGCLVTQYDKSLSFGKWLSGMWDSQSKRS